MKKLLAIILSLVMVMGMTMTTFAAPKTSATITVNEAGEATLTYLQVIKVDNTTETGWAFATDNIAADYTAALGVTDAQTAIKMLIKAVDSTAYPNLTAASSSQIDKALSNVANGETFATMANPLTVSAAGVYAIKAVETGFSYKTMAAYVGFGEVVNEEGQVVNEYPSLLDTEVTAKKSSIDLTKEVNDTVTGIGELLTFTITTKVPYIDANAVKSFVITDEISGAEYYLSGDKSIATIKMGGVTVESATFTVNGNTFSIDLTSIVTDDNAGKDIEIQYTAKVIGLEVENTAANNISGEKIDEDSTEVKTGSIKLLKTDDSDAKTPLAGAEFKLYDKADETKTYLKFKLENGVYVYDETGSDVLVTDANGLIIVKGLDEGTYHFDETKAPTGYSINEVGVDATIAADDLNTTVNELFPEVTIIDTKLSALPATGGIGTAVFTIGGCAIMIAAAYFFFVSRKKES